jgi:hypothetical protein
MEKERSFYERLKEKGVSRRDFMRVLHGADGDHGAVVILRSQGGGGVCRSCPASTGGLAAFCGVHRVFRVAVAFAVPLH